MPLWDDLAKTVVDSATALIGQFHLSPEDAVKRDQGLAQIAQQAKQQADDLEVKLNDIAGQNIRADATNGDKYTERARPTFMYVVISVIGFNYIGLPLAQVFGSKVSPIVLPADLLTLFGVCVTGYVFSRTAEKVSAMPGDSQANIFGMKIGNKS